MNENEMQFYLLLKQMLQELKQINNNLNSISNEIGNIKRRM